MRGGGWLAAALGAAWLLLLGCGPRQTTQRVFDGRTVLGRYVAPEAYAAFAEGVYLAERGEHEAALRALRRAQRRDPRSPEIATRIGALACQEDLEGGLDELDTAGLGRDYAPAWAERARCLSHHGQPTSALEAAHRAVRLAPDHPVANLLVARLQRELGQPQAAADWLFAWLLRAPQTAAAEVALQAESVALEDSALGALLREARQKTAAGRERASDPAPAAAPPGPLERARRALDAGQPASALEEASRVLRANPADPDALVTALLAASRLLDEPRLAALLAESAPEAPLRPELAGPFTELLRQRAGDEAAETWLAAWSRLSGAR